MRKPVALLVVFSLGCTEATPAVSTADTDNPALTVEKLFEHDGCSVYRFEDYGYYRYYARCKDGRISVEQDERHTRSCGKGCVQAYYVPNPIITITDSTPEPTP